jgi:hypothetical protein
VLRIQGAESTVTVRLERAHAQCLRQGEGLAVMGGGLVDVRGFATPGDVIIQSRVEERVFGSNGTENRLKRTG